MVFLFCTGEVATGKNRQLASVDAAAARDSMGAIPGIGEAVTGPHPGTFNASRPSGSPCCLVSDPARICDWAVLGATLVGSG